MSPVRLVARDELRLMARNRVAVIAFALLVLLTLAAMMSAWSHQRSTAELRERNAHVAEEQFDAQPNRHPHRSRLHRQNPSAHYVAPGQSYRHPAAG